MAKDNRYVPDMRGGYWNPRPLNLVSFNINIKNMNPSIGKIVIYNHPGSLDGKYPPVQSPAVVQKVYKLIDEDVDIVDLFVMSVTGGIFFAKSVKEGPGPSTWNWPTE